MYADVLVACHDNYNRLVLSLRVYSNTDYHNCLFYRMQSLLMRLYVLSPRPTLSQLASETIMDSEPSVWGYVTQNSTYPLCLLHAFLWSFDPQIMYAQRYDIAS